MSYDDPYYSVQNDIIKSTEAAARLYSEWKTCIKNQSARSSDVSGELKQALRGIEWNLDEIEDSVKVVESNPGKFPFTDKEVRNRRLFVNNVKTVIRSCKAQVANPLDYASNIDKIDFTSVTKFGQDVDPLIAPSGNFDNPSTLNWNSQTKNKSPQDYLQLQDVMKSEQDQQINQLSESVSRLKTMSSAIGSELTDQSALLNEFSDEMDMTQSKMTRTTQRISRILRLESDKKQWWAIIGLTITLFVILFLFFLL